MKAVDLSICAKEPIHIPGFIQPHGYLVTYDKKTSLISGYSKNIVNHPNLNTNVVDYLGEELLKKINDAIASFDSSLDLNSKTIICNDKEIYVSTTQDEVILEFINTVPQNYNTTHFDLLKSMKRINKIHNFDEKFDAIAFEFKKLTKIDRVMIYKFDEEYNGQVIAEAKEEHLNTYLNLFFPESDIPKQARQLYLRKMLRIIPNVDYTPVDFIRNTDEPLNLSDSYLRSVSPIHIEYLKNMKVNATLTISIIVEGKLWGLIACHHYNSFYLSLSQLEVLETFAQNISQIITYEIKENNAKFESSVQTIVNQININSKSNYDIGEEQGNTLLKVFDYSENLCDLYESNSLAILKDEEFFSKDNQLMDRLKNNKNDILKICLNMQGNFYQTDSLKLNHNISDFDYAGILIFKIGTEIEHYYLIWFKNEFVHDITWGGDPSNKVTIKEDGSLSPRNSFNAFVEKVHDKCKPWNGNIFLTKDKIIESFNNFLNHNYKIKSLKQLIDKHIMSLRLDLNNKITHASNAFLDTLGVSKESIKNIHINDLISTELGEDSFEKVIEMLAYQNAWEGELKFIKNDKTTLFSFTILAYEYNNIGEKKGLFLIAYDITERKKLASIQEINHILKIWQEASEQTGDGLVQYDIYKNKFSISSTLLESLGLNKYEELDIDNWYKLIHPDDYDKAVERFDKLKKGETLNNDLELRLKHKDGNYVWFIEKSFVFNSKDKSLTKIVAFYTNYNQIKNLQISQQKKIQEKKEEFETIFKINTDGIVLIDFEGNLLNYNDSFKNLLGFEDESLKNKNLINLTVLRDQGKLKQDLDNITSSKYKLNQRKSYNTNYDKIVNVEESMVVMPDNKRVLLTIKDITQTIKLENRLKEAKNSAEKANEAKSQFLANMSHEIRTPMNGIINLSKILCNENLDETSLDYANMIYTSSSSLLGILNDILDLSRIESGKISLENKVENIEELSKELINIHNITAKSKNIDLFVDISDDLPKNIVIDKLRLQQILSNLIGNSIKFTNEGVVHIILNKTIKEDKKYLEIMVRDTGIGIDPEDLERILTPFEQADISTTRKYGGTGLGLSITSKLIKIMDGKLDIYSKKGVGSTFTVSLPFIEPSVEELDEFEIETKDITNETKKETKKINILLAEDDKINQIVVSKILDETDYNLDIVNDGEEVLTTLLDKKYDLILMDNNMPKMGGIETTKVLRSQNCKLPILATSASVMDNEIKSFLDAGMNCHIPKPIDGKLLIDTIEKYLKGNYEDTQKVYQDVSQNVSQNDKLKHILVGEDDLIGQTIIKKVLEKLNYKVTIAKDGLEIVKIFKENKDDFDFIFMDLHMPNMDGFEAATLIREINKKIPIVTLSSSDTPADVQKSKEVGMNEHVSKPIKKDIIKDVLDRYLNT